MYKSVQPQKCVYIDSFVKIIQKARYFSSACGSCSARAEKSSKRRALRRSRGDTEQKRVRRLTAFPPSPHLTKKNGADAEARVCVRWYSQFSVDFGGGWIIFCTIYKRCRPLFGYLIGQMYYVFHAANYEEFGGLI